MEFICVKSQGYDLEEKKSNYFHIFMLLASDALENLFIMGLFYFKLEKEYI